MGAKQSKNRSFSLKKSERKKGGLHRENSNLSLDTISTSSVRIFPFKRKIVSKNKWQTFITISPRKEVYKEKKKFGIQILNEDLLNAQEYLKNKSTLTEIFYSYMDDFKWIDRAQETGLSLSGAFTDTKMKSLYSKSLREASLETPDLQVVTQDHNFLHCFSADKRLSIVLSCIWSFFSQNSDFDDAATERNASFSFDSILSDFTTYKAPSQESDSNVLLPFVRALKDELLTAKKRGTDLTHFINSGHWMNEAVEAFDRCSIDLCIAKVEDRGVGFPIIYANKSFQQAFETSFHELEGLDMFKVLKKFSTTAKITPFINKILDFETVEGNIPCVTESKDMNNQDAKGFETFLNFVKLEPIFSKFDGECDYVICGQIEVSGANRDSDDLKLIDEVIWTLKRFL